MFSQIAHGNYVLFDGKKSTVRPFRCYELPSLKSIKDEQHITITFIKLDTRDWLNMEVCPSEELFLKNPYNYKYRWELVIYSFSFLWQLLETLMRDNKSLENIIVDGTVNVDPNVIKAVAQHLDKQINRKKNKTINIDAERVIHDFFIFIILFKKLIICNKSKPLHYNYCIIWSWRWIVNQL